MFLSTTSIPVSLHTEFPLWRWCEGGAKSRQPSMPLLEQTQSGQIPELGYDYDTKEGLSHYLIIEGCKPLFSRVFFHT